MGSKIKAVLFDMDGVLIDSFEVLYYALKETSEKFSGKGLDRNEFAEKYWGEKLEIKVNNWWEEEGTDYYFSKIDEHIHRAKLIPGVEKAINSLSQKRGVVTNGPEGYTENFLSHFGLKKYFDVIICSDDVEKIKPDAEPILRACGILNVEPEKTVFVGDTKKDVKAGRSAGCTVIGLGVQGDYKIEHMDELPEIMSEIQNT